MRSFVCAVAVFVFPVLAASAITLRAADDIPYKNPGINVIVPIQLAQAKPVIPVIEIPLPLANIDGPVAAQAGSLVILDYSGSSGNGFLWTFPENLNESNLKEYPIEKHIVFAAGVVSARYKFTLTVASCGKDGSVLFDRIEHEVEVGSPPVIPTIPTDPTNPNPPIGKYGLIKLVQKWAEQTVREDGRKTEAVGLATAYTLIAGQIQANQFQKLQDVFEALKIANRKAVGTSLNEWLAWSVALEKEMDQLVASGKLKEDIKSYGEVYQEIARGLLEVN